MNWQQKTEHNTMRAMWDQLDSGRDKETPVREIPQCVSLGGNSG